MASELSQHERQAFQELAAQDDDYDPGIESYNMHLREAEEYLNMQGGYFCEHYRPLQAQLNEQWPYVDQLGLLTGKLYIVDDANMIDTTSGSWSDLQSDESGSFFIVEDVELMSLGILDVSSHYDPEQGEDGTMSSPVQFVYGFTVDGADDDEPMFYAHPDDILKVKYDLPTFEGIDIKLHYRWPKEMRAIDRRIDAAGYDPDKKVRLLSVAMKRVETSLLDSREFREWLARYIHTEMDFDTRWAYEVEVSGDAHYLDDESSFMPLNFIQGSNLKLLYAGFDIAVVSTPHSSKIVVSILFNSPTAQDQEEGYDKQLLIPLSSIVSMSSIRSRASITDIINGTNNASQDKSPQSAAEVMLLPEAQFDQHKQISQYKRLEQLEGRIHDWIRITMQMRSTRFRTREQADEVSRNLIHMFAQEIDQLQLEQSDMICVSGVGVLKANADLTIGVGKFHLDTKQDMPVSTPPRATDIVGYYGALLAEVDQYEDADGEFWQVAPAMAVITFDEKQVIVGGSYPFVATSLKSAATARIDSTVEYTLPQLDRMRKRNENLTALAMSHRKTKELHAIRQLAIAFMETDPDTWSDMRNNLKRIRDISSAILGTDDNELLEALRQQLVDRTVQLVGETWLGKDLSRGHLSNGIIIDVVRMMMPDGDEDVVAAVTSNPGSSKDKDVTLSQLVSLTKLEQLRF